MAMKAAKRQRHRAGMTLVELLVVVSILVLLSAVVLPNLAGREGTRAVQLASANVSAQFAKAQSVAISRRASHGIWLDPVPSNAAACIDLYYSDVPDPYRGDTFDAKFTVTPAAPPAAPITATLAPTPTGCVASLASPAFGNFTNPGNLVQFNDVGPLYDLRLTGGNLVARLRPAMSQTPANSLWPSPAPAAHRFAVYRMPTRAGQPLTLPAGMAIDVAWSGIATGRFGTTALSGDGSTTATSSDNWITDTDYQNASIGTPATIVAMYDASGAFAEICYIANTAASSTTRSAAQGPLYLLVGRVDRCGLPYNPALTDDNPGANWQYRDSRWIAVDPRTGIVKVAEPLVGASILTARASQALIRSGLTAIAR
jgi:prepilin-type N-terminal cleavage/methylation domain-containing protein